MKHRESEQTQLRVSRLLNRDSVMLHAEMPSVQTALETLVEAIDLPKCKVCTHCFDGSSCF